MLRFPLATLAILGSQASATPLATPDSPLVTGLQILTAPRAVKGALERAIGSTVGRDADRDGPQEARPPRDPSAAAVLPIRRRVLQTAGGGVLRGRSRMGEDGLWQIELGRGWKELPSGAVESAVLETDLLDEFEAKKADGDLPPADLLEWTLGAGLLKEAFELGDRLITEYPRDVDLRSVAAGQASRYIAGLPERGAESELEDLRELGSKGSPFVAEALVERLAVAGSRAEVLAAAQEDLGSRDAGRRSFGAMALGRLFPTEDPRALLLHSIYDPSPQVRRASALGLADMSASEVCGPLVKALASPSASVRRRAAEALGETRESIFVEPLMDRLLTQSASGSSGAPSLPRGYVSIGTQRAYVQDFDVEVAAGSSISDPVVNTLLEGAVLGAGVISIEKTTITMERRSVRRALQLASGVQPGRGQLRDWKKWWESDDSAPFRQD